MSGGANEWLAVSFYAPTRRGRAGGRPLVRAGFWVSTNLFAPVTSGKFVEQRTCSRQPTRVLLDLHAVLSEYGRLLVVYGRKPRKYELAPFVPSVFAKGLPAFERLRLAVREGE